MQGPVLAVLPEPKMEEMKENVDFEAIAANGHHVSCFRKGDFPPPLPSLPRKSYNHLPLQVPWVVLQAERGNNRVVLHEVKTAQQTMHMFQPIRKEGRLVLHMVRHDSDDEDGLAASPSASVTAESTILSASSVSSTELNSEIAHEDAAAIEAAVGGMIAGEGGSSSGGIVFADSQLTTGSFHVN